MVSGVFRLVNSGSARKVLEADDKITLRLQMIFTRAEDGPGLEKW